jgi:hypothetical protein
MTNIVAIGIMEVVQQPLYLNDFLTGATLGGVVVAFCFGLSMLRTITTDDNEDL